MATITVLSGPERRRRWSAAEKLRIVEESMTPDARVNEVARRYDVHPNLLHLWRRQAAPGIWRAARMAAPGLCRLRFPPTIDAEMARGFSLYMLEAVSGGQVMNSSIWRAPTSGAER